MRILLIDPPFKRFTGFVNFYFPLGLTYLAAVLKNAEHEVLVFDADAMVKNLDLNFSDGYRRLSLYCKGINDEENVVWQDIKAILDDYNPDLVGITAMTTKFGSVLKTAEVVKKHNPEYKVVIGGPHPTLLPEQSLKSKYIDIALRGEGEKTFPELIDAIKNRSGLQNVKGISYKENGSILHNPDRPFIQNLDEIPFPARDLLMNPQSYTSEDVGMIMTSRGCPFNCSYCCHMWQKKVRNRSVENVMQEIKQVQKTFGTRQFEFKDDSFTLNKKRIMRLCDEIVLEKLKINWGCSTRVNLLDEELIKKMKKAGCNIVKLGIETGSEKILKETKKGVTFDQMRKAAQLLNKHHIFWSGYFMLGLPTETEEDILKTYEFMKELNPYYAGLGVYNPFPRTDLFDQGVKMGLLHAEVELEHFFNTNPKDYFFTDPSKRVAAIGKQRFDELVDFLNKKFHKHNTKPKNMLRRGWARRQVYFNEPRLLVEDLKKAFKWGFMQGGRNK